MDHSLRAYGWTLAAICYLVSVGALLAAVGKYTEALGVAAAVTGLVGVIRMPQAKTVTIDNPPSQPVPTEAQ